MKPYTGKHRGREYQYKWKGGNFWHSRRTQSGCYRKMKRIQLEYQNALRSKKKNERQQARKEIDKELILLL